MQARRNRQGAGYDEQRQFMKRPPLRRILYVEDGIDIQTPD